MALKNGFRRISLGHVEQPSSDAQNVNPRGVQHAARPEPSLGLSQKDTLLVAGHNPAPDLGEGEASSFAGAEGLAQVSK